MEQMARNLIDSEDGFLREKRYLIADRDPLYTASFRRTSKSCGVKVLKLPPCSPNLNAFAERFVLSIKSECLNRMIPLGESHLRQAISEYMIHYHRERNHQGLDNALISPDPAILTSTKVVTARQRLGRLLNFYHRADVSTARS
jgi:transposase InsO family protein